MAAKAITAKNFGDSREEVMAAAPVKQWTRAARQSVVSELRFIVQLSFVCPTIYSAFRQPGRTSRRAAALLVADGRRAVCNSAIRVLTSASSKFSKEAIMSENDGGGAGFLWFLAGLGIGAAVGILYAPKSGEEMRQQLRSAAEDGTNTVKERARQAREQAGSWAEKGRDYLNTQKEQIRSAVEAGRSAYREATGEEVGGATPNVP
jgi:gas vesicle protein